MLVSLSGASCTSVRYLTQAAGGQLELAQKARPIDDVLKDERTPFRVRDLLKEVSAAKKFAEAQGLKPTRNYEHYVPLNRPAAVWVVSASDRLAFRSKEWRFPFFGSFPFLGWFDRKNADSFAEELRKENLDVDVRGAGAFSTLGWFRDPILSTMFYPGDEAQGELVNVVIHESVHATLYLKDQTYFNESLASFVAEELTPIYLAKRWGSDSKELKQYVAFNQLHEKRNEALLQGYQKLQALYSQALPDEEKQRQKEQIFSELKVKTGIQREINNATLIQFKSYGVGLKEFHKLLNNGCGGDWSRFWELMKRFEKRSPFHQDHEVGVGEALEPYARCTSP